MGRNQKDGSNVRLRLRRRSTVSVVEPVRVVKIAEADSSDGEVLLDVADEESQNMDGESDVVAS